MTFEFASVRIASHPATSDTMTAVCDALVANLGLLRIMFHEAGQRDLCPPVDVIFDDLIVKFGYQGKQAESTALWSLLLQSQPSTGHAVVDYRLFSRTLRRYKQQQADVLQRKLMCYKASGGREPLVKNKSKNGGPPPKPSTDAASSASPAAATVTDKQLPTKSVAFVNALLPQPPAAPANQSRRGRTARDVHELALLPPPTPPTVDWLSLLKRVFPQVVSAASHAAWAAAMPLAMTLDEFARALSHPIVTQAVPGLPPWDHFAIRTLFACASQRGIDFRPEADERVALSRLAFVVGIKHIPCRASTSSHSSQGVKEAFEWSRTRQGGPVPADGSQPPLVAPRTAGVNFDGLPLPPPSPGTARLHSSQSSTRAARLRETFNAAQRQASRLGLSGALGLDALRPRSASSSFMNLRRPHLRRGGPDPQQDVANAA